MSASTIGAAAGFVGGGPLGALFGFQIGSGVDTLNETKKMRQSQDRLEQQRAAELSAQAAAREAAAARAATGGSRVGLRSSFTKGFGFGSGNSPAGIGAGTLFGNA